MAAASVNASAIAPPSVPPMALMAVPKSVIPAITLLRKSLLNLFNDAVSAGVLDNSASVNAANSSVLTPSAVAYACCLFNVVVICLICTSRCLSSRAPSSCRLDNSLPMRFALSSKLIPSAAPLSVAAMKLSVNATKDRLPKLCTTLL